MKVKVGMVFILVLMLGLLGVYLYGDGGSESDMAAKAEQTYLFVSPAFAQSASLNTTFLEEEAGMSIYVNVGAVINLSVARTAYKTIEKETSEYIIGSLSLPGLPETEDVHCFVHKDGWIVVYYLKAEPISKIIDWKNYNYSANKISKNKLQLGLDKMGNATGATVTNVKYYNFQYPNATKWMIIIDWRDGAGTDSFNLKIPGNFTVYERSWSHYAQNIDEWFREYAYFRIDGSIINTITEDGKTEYGQLTAAQLSPDVFHTISIDCDKYGRQSGAIALAYKES